ncbi:hypothetical protein A4X13_0g115 [Tilletia indica]|uniref:Glyoxalase-like domain-containing protein n=1 Tax=Tilletia indica TaxID=43049 RepID=A0A177TPZ0_9BASI|nr:hypothetical protein A4X13_0g115 [Tilletia indica]
MTDNIPPLTAPATSAASETAMTETAPAEALHKDTPGVIVAPITSSPPAAADLDLPLADPVEPQPQPQVEDAPAPASASDAVTPATPPKPVTPAPAPAPAPAVPQAQKTPSPPPKHLSPTTAARKKNSPAPKTHTKPLPPTPSASLSSDLSVSSETGAITLAAPLSAPLPAIDHLIHRCSSIADLRVAIKTFSALGFTVLEGGQHADGLTRNALIVFADGSYLEFIAFEDEPTNPDGTPKRSHHSRSASSGSGPGSWFASFRRERRPSAASATIAEKPPAANRPSTAVSQTSEKAEDTPTSPVPITETKEEFLARRAKHWWWDTPSKGWIDFAFTTGVAPANQKKEYQAEAKRGGPYRTPSLHRTAIVNANAASAAAASKKAALAALTSKPMPAIPRPMPEDGSAITGRRPSAAIGGPGSPNPDATSESEDLEPISYDPPMELGRQTKDGKHLKFEVIFPHTARRRVPFFTEDVTPRHLRAPPAANRHPNGSTGLSAVTLLYATTASFQQALNTLCPLLGVSSVNKVLHTHPAISSTTFDLRVRTPSSLAPPSSASRSSGMKKEAAAGAKPIPASLANIGRRGSGAGRPMSSEGEVGDTSQDSQTSQTSTSHSNSNPTPAPHIHTIPLHIRVAQDVQERAHVEQYGEGLYEVEIFVAADRLPQMAPPDGIERTGAQLGYGRIRLHPIFVSMLPVQAQAQVGFGVGPGPGASVVGGSAAAAGPLKQTTI